MNINKNAIIKGSLTIECALIFPVFLYAVIGILSFFQIYLLHDMLQQAITVEGLGLAKYGYVHQYITGYEEEKNTGQGDMPEKVDENEKNGNETNGNETDDTLKDILLTKSINAAFIHGRLGDYVDEDYINRSIIKGGMSGISAYLSDFMGEEDRIDIILTYYVEPPAVLLPVKKFFIMQRVTLRGWSGYSPPGPEEGTEDEKYGDTAYVYVAESGNVYHLWEDCTYLKLSIKQVPWESVSGRRNLSGGKYYPCELCGDRGTLGTVYITDTGDRYHTDINCSGLKRTVTRIPLSEAGDRLLCKRCGKRQEGSH